MERAAAKLGIKGTLQEDRHFLRQGEQFWWPTGCSSRTQAVRQQMKLLVTKLNSNMLFFFLVDYSFFF